MWPKLKSVKTVPSLGPEVWATDDHVTQASPTEWLSGPLPTVHLCCGFAVMRTASSRLSSGTGCLAMKSPWEAGPREKSLTLEDHLLSPLYKAMSGFRLVLVHLSLLNPVSVEYAVTFICDHQSHLTKRWTLLSKMLETKCFRLKNNPDFRMFVCPLLVKHPLSENPRLASNLQS